MGRNFKTIKAWELADNLVVEIYRVTRLFPKEELYGQEVVGLYGLKRKLGGLRTVFSSFAGS